MTDDKLHPIDPIIHMESLVSAQTGKAVVHLHWGPMDGKLTPAEARMHAYSLLETANAAEEDAFLFEWLTKVVGGAPEKSIMVLRDFREWREKQKP